MTDQQSKYVNTVGELGYDKGPIISTMRFARVTIVGIDVAGSLLYIY